jgi:hypothetical protein
MPLIAAARKTSAFCMQSPENKSVTGEKPLVKDAVFAI